jgi:hypothetical protein
MNTIYICQATQFSQEPTAFNIQLEEADRYLQILRADHFSKVTVILPENVLEKQLRFMMHLSRILKQKVSHFVKIRAKFVLPTKQTATSTRNLLTLPQSWACTITETNKILYSSRSKRSSSIKSNNLCK